MIKIIKSILLVYLFGICSISFADELVSDNKNIVALTCVENNIANVMAVRILQEAYRKIGYTVKTVDLPAERSLVKANNGEFDGLVVRTSKLETGFKKKYPNLVKVPAKVSYLDLAIFSKDPSFTVTKIADLKHKKIGVMFGNKWLSSLTKDFNTVRASNIESLFLMLNRNRFDVIIFPQIIGTDIINRLSLKNVVVNNPSIKKIDIYHYLHRKNDKLVPRISSILEEMDQENESLYIRKMWVESCLHNSQTKDSNCF